MSTSAMAWNVSGGTVLANISKRVLSLSAFAVEAGDTCMPQSPDETLQFGHLRSNFRHSFLAAELANFNYEVAVFDLEKGALFPLSP